MKKNSSALKFLFFIAMIVLVIGFFIHSKEEAIRNNIKLPSIPTSYSLFTQLPTGEILKTGGEISTNYIPNFYQKGIITNQAELYNPNTKNFELIQKTDFEFIRGLAIFSDSLVLEDGRALIISSEAHLMDIYNPFKKTFTLSKNLFFGMSAKSTVRLIQMKNHLVFIVLGNEYIVYNPRNDEIILHEYYDGLYTAENVVSSREENIPGFSYNDPDLRLTNLRNGNVLITKKGGALIYNAYLNDFKPISTTTLSKQDFDNPSIKLGVPVKLQDGRILFFGAFSDGKKVLYFNETTEQFEVIGELQNGQASLTPILLDNDNVYIIGTNESKLKTGTQEQYFQKHYFWKDREKSSAQKTPCEIYNTKTNTSEVTKTVPYLTISETNMQGFKQDDEAIIAADHCEYTDKKGKFNYGAQLIEQINIKNINR